MRYTLLFAVILALTACGTDYVASVQGGTMAFDKTRSLGDALGGANKILKNQAWTTEDRGGRKLVIFKADINDPNNALSNQFLAQVVSMGGCPESQTTGLQVASYASRVLFEFAVNKDGESFEVLRGANYVKAKIYNQKKELVKDTEYELSGADAEALLKFHYPQ